MKNHRRKDRARETSAPKPENGRVSPQALALSSCERIRDGSRAGEASAGGEAARADPGPAGGRARVRDYPSIKRTSPARGPFGDSSAVNSTRCPSRSSSNTEPRTALRWKKCSTPPSSRMNPNPLSMRRRAIVPVGIAVSSDARKPEGISGASRPLYERTYEATGGTAAPTRADVSSASVGTGGIEVKEQHRRYPQHRDASQAIADRRHAPERRRPE